MNKIYTDRMGRKIDLSKLSFQKLEELNYQEETYFAKEILKLPPFSKQRNNYMKKAYQKIFQIADYKELKNPIPKLANGVTDYTIELLNKIINKKLKKQDKLLFYEAGVGKGIALKNINRDNLIIKGCDIFLSEEAKILAKDNKNISLIEQDLYTALDKINDNTIDIFYADNVLEHIVKDEYELTCQKIISKIKNGGLAILIIPNSYVGPHDISKTKLPTGSKALGFHFNEQTFEGVAKLFKKYDMILTCFYIRTFEGKIITVLKGKILNLGKIKLEKIFGKIRDIRLRKHLFKYMGYNLYIFKKK